MNDYLAKLFQNSGLSEGEISTYRDDFSKVFLLSLLGQAESRLNDRESLSVEKQINEGKIEDVLALVKSKFSKEEFRALLQNVLGGLVKEYREKVIKGK